MTWGCMVGVSVEIIDLEREVGCMEAIQHDCGHLLGITSSDGSSKILAALRDRLGLGAAFAVRIVAGIGLFVGGKRIGSDKAFRLAEHLG